MVVVAPPASAAEIAVETTADTIAADGDCSLREAVIAANENTPQTGCPAGDVGHDTIEIPAGTYELTIEGREEDEARTGDLDILEPVSFLGLGGFSYEVVVTAGGGGTSVVDCFSSTSGSPAGENGSGIDRVFHIPQVVQGLGGSPAGAPSYDVNMDLMTIEGGEVQGDSFPAGGGILNETATLTMTDTVVQNNFVTDLSGGGKGVLGGPLGPGGSGIAGGGIATLFDSRLVMVDSIVRQNSGFSFGPGTGGGIANQAFFLNGQDPESASLEDLETETGAPAADAPSPPAGSPPSVDLTDTLVRENALCSLTAAIGGGLSGREFVDIDDTRFVENVVVSSMATGGGADIGGAFDGGSQATGFADIRRSTFRDNHAISVSFTGGESPFGDFLAAGGGMAGASEIDVTTSTFRGNTTEFFNFGKGGPSDDVYMLGGGAAQAYGFADFNRTTFEDNHANPPSIARTAEDLGLEDEAGGPAGFSAFIARGGGFYSQAAGEATNSTFSGNSADEGGGIAHEEVPPPPPPPPEGSPQGNGQELHLENVTVTDNSASNGGGIFVDGGDGGPVVSFSASIIANQEDGSDCEQSGKGDFLDSEGNNLDSDDTCDLDSGLDDLPDTNPMLEEIDDNGGPTRTHLPEPASPAVDHYGAKGCVAIDQRGVERPQDAGGGPLCDIGAVELEGEPEFCPGFAGDPRPQIVGTPDPDTIEGTAQNEIICGLGGRDTLKGMGGKDLVLGNGNDDDIFGNGGDDVLRGGGRDDVMKGNDGDDRIRGFTGLDDIFGNDGDDDIGGGRDDDEIVGGSGDDFLLGWGGQDTILGQQGSDELQGTGDDDDLFGGPDKDLVKGNIGDDDLFGDDGRDKLVGFRGDDDLDGGPDPDECYGGPGINTLANC